MIYYLRVCRLLLLPFMLLLSPAGCGSLRQPQTSAIPQAERLNVPAAAEEAPAADEFHTEELLTDESRAPETSAEEAPPPEDEPPGQDSGPRFAAIPDNPRPGEPITVALALEQAPETGPLRAVLFGAGGKRLGAASFFRVEHTGTPLWAAVLAVPSLAAPGPASVRLESGAELLGAIPLDIGSRDFIAEEIPLNAGNTALRTVPDPQKTAESERLWAILNHTGTGIYGGGAFQAPVGSTRRTSFFGDRRVYRYSNGKSDTSVHAGIDYGVPTGTAVSACAPGKVVLARPRIVTGNSVIIEHLPGLYSLYYHLDAIHVDEGAMVETGALLGESGATGLATGPHLHWEIRAAGENADPDAFMARPILDKPALLDKLYPGAAADAR
ncbi:MAG: M23 family metallopeptidase [Treponema sp.]|nr:M23 family metallopeptidase [Treponema sp.]